MEKKYQIFISSTFEDLKEERKKVQDTILEMYQFPMGMEMFSAADEEQWEIIRETIDSSDYYVVIIGHRYGSVIQEGKYVGISYTQKEFRYALEHKIPVLAFLIDNFVAVTPDKMDQDVGKRKKLEEFVKEVKTGRTVQWWISKEDLANKVMNSLNKQISKGKRPGWVRAGGLKLQETQAELVEMSKKIRKLEEENEELRKRAVVRKPQFKFEINGGQELYFNYQNINMNDVKADFLPLTKVEIENYEISQSDVEEYHQSLPTSEELEKYLNEYRFYESMEKNSIPFKFEYRNIGNKKANDIHIRISFPDGLLLVSKEKVTERKKPKKPKTLENPIYKCLKRNMGLDVIGQVYDVLNMRVGFENLTMPLLSSTYSKNYNEEIEDNSLVIWNRGLIHTENECSIEYYLIPAGEGRYKAKIFAICEELEEEITQEFEITVESKMNDY